MPEKTKKKVLLAEDDKYISIAYKDGLGRAGFEVVIATDGAEALEKIKTDTPDIVLLDLVMPVKDGFEVLEALKADGTIKKLPVIILSNLGQVSDVEKGKALGAVDYMIKADFSMKEVIEKVNSILAKKK